MYSDLCRRMLTGDPQDAGFQRRSRPYGCPDQRTGCSDVWHDSSWAGLDDWWGVLACRPRHLRQLSRQEADDNLSGDHCVAAAARRRDHACWYCCCQEGVMNEGGNRVGGWGGQWGQPQPHPPLWWAWCGRAELFLLLIKFGSKLADTRTLVYLGRIARPWSTLNTVGKSFFFCPPLFLPLACAELSTRILFAWWIFSLRVSRKQPIEWLIARINLWVYFPVNAING